MPSSCSKGLRRERRVQREEALGVGSERLGAALRAGAHDAELDDLVDPRRAEVRAKLEVANPRWIT